MPSGSAKVCSIAVFTHTDPDSGDQAASVEAAEAASIAKIQKQWGGCARHT